MTFDPDKARERLDMDRLIKAGSLGDAAWIVCEKHGFTARDPYQPECCVWCLAERNAPEDCHCGHSEGLHLCGPESWGECDAADCDCDMYCPRSEWDALDVGAWWQ